MDLWQIIVNALVFVAVAACLHPVYRAWLRRRERKQTDVAAWRAAENAEYQARQKEEKV